MNIDFVIIGNPENRRVVFFQQALELLNLKPAKVVSYIDLLTGANKIEDYIKDDVIIRLESPGENFLVEKELIALGEEDGWISAVEARGLEYENGRIYYPAQWYRGFCSFLKRIDDRVNKAGKRFQWMNPPGDIITMFDKRLCQKLLRDSGVSVPSVLKKCGSYEEVQEVMKETNIRRVFVKLACSSSASGICAYQINPRGDKEVMYTTVEIVRRDGELALYNSLKIKKYTSNRDIKDIIDWICGQGAHIEVWIHKETFERQVFDMRIVTIGESACHNVARLSKSPMTNLHLGNKRGNVADLNLSPDKLVGIFQEAERAKGVFKRSLYAGIDVLVSKGGHVPYVVDVNAFGDLIPGILYKGRDTYGAEIEEMINNIERGD
ncbi:MAG: STM4014 family protein [Clostridia bacterium]|nr:STM4014 family protein [Clostridia bacterium]